MKEVQGVDRVDLYSATVRRFKMCLSEWSALSVETRLEPTNSIKFLLQHAPCFKAGDNRDRTSFGKVSFLTKETAWLIYGLDAAAPNKNMRPASGITDHHFQGVTVSSPKILWPCFLFQSFDLAPRSSC